MSTEGCVFCKIIAGTIATDVVYEDAHVIVFLDNAPLFPGHCLVCPRQHYDTLMDVPREALSSLFGAVQLIGQAVEKGLDAQGSFVAVNNKVSQSVPHLHVHVIPRRRGDGMKGFFWPRRPYKDKEHATSTVKALQDALAALQA